MRLDPVLSVALLYMGELILFQFKEFPDMDTLIVTVAIKYFHISYDAIGLESVIF